MNPIGLEPLGEPDDYLDYVRLQGVELRRRLSVIPAVNFGPRAPYKPQARLDFDGHRMVLDVLIVRDVASMVFDSVALKPYLLKAVFAGDLQIPVDDAG